MIILDKSSWLRIVFAVRGCSLADIWPGIVLVTLFAAAVSWTPLRQVIERHTLTTTPFSLIGVSLAIFCGFRNKESYDRYWEGRTLWGRMVNVIRRFTRQMLTLVKADPDSQSDDATKLRRTVVRSTIACVHAFRHHLRGTSPERELHQYRTDEDRDRAAIRNRQERPATRFHFENNRDQPPPAPRRGKRPAPHRAQRRRAATAWVSR